MASWEGGGTPETRLKDWLDPDNTGVIEVDGLDLDFFVAANPSNSAICLPEDVVVDISVSENFENPVSLTLNPAAPAGVTATFSQNPVNAGGNVTLSFSGTQNFGDGVFSFAIDATDGINSTTTPIRISAVSEVPVLGTLSEPADQAVDVSTSLSLNWESQADADVYDLQIATDANFTNIVTTINDVVETTSLVSNLEILTDYFWRVRGINTCGVGDWTNAFTFKTAAVFCNNKAYDSDPVTIGMNAGDQAIATESISLVGAISDVKITDLRIDHTFAGDLLVELISPSGTSIVLFDRLGVGQGGGYGCGADNLLLSFSDFASATADELEVTCEPGPAATGEFQPVDPLSTFNGEDANGDWTIEVTDFAAADGGQLVSFNLEICANLPNTTDIVPAAQAIETCQNSTETFSILVGTAYENDVTLEATGLPASVTISYSDNPASPGSNVEVTLETGSTPAGDYTITWSGDDGTSSGSGTSTLTINEGPGTFALLEPADASEVLNTLPTLDWANSSNSDEYQVEVATDANFSDIVIDLSLNFTEYTFTSDLTPGTTYYWRVVSRNTCGDVMSEVFSFTVGTSAVVDLNGMELQIVPNPFKDFVDVQILGGTNIETDYNWTILSASGQLIKSGNLQGSFTIVPTTELAAGIYFIQISTNKDQVVERVVKF